MKDNILFYIDTNSDCAREIYYKTCDPTRNTGAEAPIHTY